VNLGAGRPQHRWVGRQLTLTPVTHLPDIIEIENRRDELKKRIKQANENKKHFSLGDRDDLGHLKQFVAKQKNLIRLLERYIDNDCNCTKLDDDIADLIDEELPAPGGGERPPPYDDLDTYPEPAPEADHDWDSWWNPFD
jgi:hypothetical protein